MKPLHPLEKFRRHKRIKQAELARLLGVSTATVTRYVKGDRRVDRSLWKPFSDITGIPEAALAGLEAWDPPTDA